MNFEIRPAEISDYPEIGRIAVASYRQAGILPEGVDYESTLRDAASRARDTELLVAIDTHKGVLGSVAMCLPGSALAEIAVGDGELEFRMLSVDPAAQGRGVGEALVRACVARAREVGCRAVVLSTKQFSEVTAAQRLYQRLGFVRLPERDWSPVPDVRLIAMICALE